MYLASLNLFNWQQIIKFQDLKGNHLPHSFRSPSEVFQKAISYLPTYENRTSPVQSSFSNSAVLRPPDSFFQPDCQTDPDLKLIPPMHAGRDTAPSQVLPSSSPVILSLCLPTRKVTSTIKASLKEKLPQKDPFSPPRQISPDFEFGGMFLSNQHLSMLTRHRMRSSPTRNIEKNRSKGQRCHKYQSNRQESVVHSRWPPAS